MTGTGVGEATGVGVVETDGDSVGLGDGVSSTAVAGAVNDRTTADEIAATDSERQRERVERDIYLKID